jgi:lambda family phage tail tape measure protein
MATQNYNVNVNTTQAVAAMTRLQQSASRVNAAFGGLKTAIGGLALGAAISSALRYADAINDISEATGIGTANILGFSRAVAANGGSAESAQASILRLSQSIDEAASGSAKTQYQFAQIGVSLQDLATLSEQDILARTVEGLSKIEDNSRRIALATDLLGKSARSINFAGVNASLATSIAQSQQYAASQKAAAELQDKLNYAVDQFRVSLLKALGPLINFLNTLKPEQIDRFVEAVVKIGGAAVAITALGTAISKILPLLTSLGGIAASAFLLFKTGAAQATTTVLNLGIRWNGFLKAFGKADSIFGKIVELFRHLGFHATKTLPFLIGGFLRMIPGIGLVTSALYALNEIISLVFNYDPLAKFIQGLKSVGAALGIISPEKEFKVTEGVGTGSGPRGSIGTGREAEDQRQTKIREVNDGLTKQRKELQEITKAFADQNRQIAENYVKEAGYINLSEETVQVLKAQDDVYKRAADAVKELQDKKAGLKDEEKGLIPVINQQIKAINDRARVDSEMIKASIEALQTQQLLERDRVANIERITEAMAKQQDIADELNRIRKEGNMSIADAEAEGAQAALTPLQRQIEIISRANQKAAQQAAESFAKQFEGMELTAKQAQQLADGLEMITQQYYKLTEVQVKNLSNSRNFATGWKKAFDEYVDAATNAAAKAERLFMKFTSGIEDALVDFVKTGKLNWKSFVADMAEELLRNQIKETIASFGQSLGLGSIFGGSSSGSAIGSSPSKPMYVVDISGGGFGGSTNGSGGGGSILDSILGGSKSGSSGGGFFDSILNVGKSIFGGIGDLFGGFFANGGMIPAGKFGIVGERGPEFVGGPASVTPMGGGSVVYNINATDAASFQALIARDPGFIHSVAELGRSRLPGARR